MAKAKKKKATKKKRSPAQIAAFQRMLAARAASQGKARPKRKTAKKKAAKKAAKKVPKKKAAKRPAKKTAKKKGTKKKTPAQRMAKRLGTPARKKAGKKVARRGAPKAAGRGKLARVDIGAKYAHAGTLAEIQYRTATGEIKRLAPGPLRLAYAGNTLLVTPTTNLPFESPGIVGGTRLGTVTGLSYRWANTNHTHLFNGVLPNLIELPGGVYAVRAVRWTRQKGFHDAT